MTRQGLSLGISHTMLPSLSFFPLVNALPREDDQIVLDCNFFLFFSSLSSWINPKKFPYPSQIWGSKFSRDDLRRVWFFSNPSLEGALGA